MITDSVTPASLVGAGVIARRFGVTPETVKRLVNRPVDPLPASRFGRRYKFDLAEVEEWARSQVLCKGQSQPAPAMSARRQREIEAADRECARRLGESV